MSQQDKHSQRESAVPTQVEPLTFEAGLAGRIRHAWHNVAGRWAIQHLIEQQNRFNQFVYRVLRENTEWLSAQDRENSSLKRQVAELSLQLGQSQRHLAELEERLQALERPSS